MLHHLEHTTARVLVLPEGAEVEHPLRETLPHAREPRQVEDDQVCVPCVFAVLLPPLVAIVCHHVQI